MDPWRLMEQAKRPGAVKDNCFRASQEHASEFPETHVSAAYAYSPLDLSPEKRAELDKLFSENKAFKKVVVGMKRDRKWLAPQYGY